MVKEIDINNLEEAGDIQFEEQKDLRSADIKSMEAERTVLPRLLIKSGLVANHKTANWVLIAISIVCFGVSIILFAVASSEAVDLTTDRSPVVNSYLFGTTTPTTATTTAN